MPLTLSQIQQATLTSTFITSANTFDNVPGLVVTISPSAATSSIWVLCSVAAGADGSGNPIYFCLTRNGTPIFIGDAAGSRLQVSGGVGHHFPGNPTNWTLNYIDAPATTSPVVYQVQVVNPAIGGNAYINQTSVDTNNNLFGRSSSSITAIEIPI